MRQERLQQAGAILIAYWKGETPDDALMFRACGQLAGIALAAMKTRKRSLVQRDPERYRAEIMSQLKQLAIDDPGAAELIATLAGIPTVTRQRDVPKAPAIIVKGDYTQVNTGNVADTIAHTVYASRERSIAGGSGQDGTEIEDQRSHLQTAKAGEPLAQRTDALQESVELSVRFVPGKPIALLWESVYSGTTESRLELPFTTEQILLVLRALDAVQHPGHPQQGPKFTDPEQQQLTLMGLWHSGRVPTDIDRRIGQRLYKAVMIDPKAHSALDSVRNIAIDKGLPLSLVLRFAPEAVQLAALPWELLWDDRLPLLLRSGRPSSCVRYIDLAQAVPAPRANTKPLRVLAVCPSQGVPDGLHIEERRQREQAFQPLVDAGLMTVDELRPVNRRDLTDRLQDGSPVDVLHFYGHGVWSQGVAHLWLDDALISAGQLAALLGDIPLVVLHACRSGGATPDDLFTGIAPMLSAEGVGAVVAMQFTVRVVAANRFSSVLYRNIAQGASLQRSVAKARQALYVEHPESWYVPVLYIRSRDLRPLHLIQA